MLNYTAVAELTSTWGGVVARGRLHFQAEAFTAQEGSGCLVGGVPDVI
ncbi:hypothetical protein ACXZ66_14160 (plasmid) [Corynebacterium sp. S7]|nr:MULTISPECIES: hypothetical protein [Corynebacterium]QJS15310.1 hypothetical protein HK412_02885 [Corynebacterium glutamicum]QXU46606.1 hypothetical protein KW808_04860 [[Brevibacterium] flavum]WFP70792.1 hypothetical protein P9K31_09980 [Corynebacterium glutamicum]HJE11261.1 hypothetical protein [Corynebacterium glutamicum]